MSVYSLFQLLGGVGLFLYGMTMMSSGLQNACGDRLQSILEKATRNRLFAVISGILITILIQSSSATDVMVIGFVNAGLMDLYQAIGVIMGANIGTTVTAQITALDVSAIAPLLVFVGTVMMVFIKKDKVRHIGGIVLGFGMLFIGISLMKSAISPLAQSEEFISFVARVSNPFVLFLFGIAFTMLLQSSSSSIVIFQAFAMEGLISYEAAVYLVIGAPLGSTITGILAGLTANTTGKRCAALNLIFNLLRAFLILGIVTLFPQVLTLIKSTAIGNIGRQVANTHTIFAVFSVLVLLPLSKVIILLSSLAVPESEEESRKRSRQQFQYLTQTEKVPVTYVLEQAHKEIARIGQIALDNLVLASESFFALDEEKKEEVLANEETIDYLTRAVVETLSKLRLNDSSAQTQNRLYQLVRVVDDIERISDHAVNITEYEKSIREKRASLNPGAILDLQELVRATIDSVEISLEIFRDEDFEKIGEALEKEDLVDVIQDRIVQNHIVRLTQEICEPNGGVIFTDMSIDLERCSDHAINIATSLMER